MGVIEKKKKKRGEVRTNCADISINKGLILSQHGVGDLLYICISYTGGREMSDEWAASFSLRAFNCERKSGGGENRKWEIIRPPPNRGGG